MVDLKRYWRANLSLYSISGSREQSNHLVALCLSVFFGRSPAGDNFQVFIFSFEFIAIVLEILKAPPNRRERKYCSTQISFFVFLSYFEQKEKLKANNSMFEMMARFSEKNGNFGTLVETFQNLLFSSPILY